MGAAEGVGKAGEDDPALDAVVVPVASSGKGEDVCCCWVPPLAVLASTRVADFAEALAGAGGMRDKKARMTLPGTATTTEKERGDDEEAGHRFALRVAPLGGRVERLAYSLVGFARVRGRFLVEGRRERVAGRSRCRRRRRRGGGISPLE